MNNVILSKNQTYVATLNTEEFAKFLEEVGDCKKTIEERKGMKVHQFPDNSTMLKYKVWKIKEDIASGK